VPEENLSTRENLNVRRKTFRRKPEYQGKPEYKEKARVPENNMSTRGKPEPFMWFISLLKLVYIRILNN
jgi:hypothetical protein